MRSGASGIQTPVAALCASPSPGRQEVRRAGGRRGRWRTGSPVTSALCGVTVPPAAFCGAFIGPGGDGGSSVFSQSPRSAELLNNKQKLGVSALPRGEEERSEGSIPGFRELTHCRCFLMIRTGPVWALDWTRRCLVSRTDGMFSFDSDYLTAGVRGNSAGFCGFLSISGHWERGVWIIWSIDVLNEPQVLTTTRKPADAAALQDWS